jgi:endonuclease/exonuclease/phosphatase family metal-dependent hydrolase
MSPLPLSLTRTTACIRPRWLVRAGLVLALLLSGLTSVRAATSPASTAGLVVMTYNVRYASNTPPNDWPARRPLVREVIAQSNPDVIGTQEGVYSQLRDLAQDLPEYDWIGLGREGGSRGEFMAVFYRRDRLEPLAYDHFWLSDTPDVVGSATWGNRYRRMVTSVHFRDRRTGREFHFWNTHFDHEVQVARERSAALIRERVGALADGLPVVLAGDFNAGAGANPVYPALVGDGFFQDTWPLARERRGEGYGTFNGFGTSPGGGERIDWILVRGGEALAVAASEIVTLVRDGQYPSDHYPVVAWLEWR